MQHKRHSLGFILILSCILVLILAACRTSSSSPRQSFHSRTNRLILHEQTPNASAAAEYVGQVPADKAWIGISTTGKRMVAFVTDGSQGHTPTFAQWFRGPTTNGTVNATSPAKTGADRLQANLNGSTATGTVTLANGKSIPFTAQAVPTTDQVAGLYRSEHKANNEDYIAGWVVMPTTGMAGTATPTGTSAITPTVTGTATPAGTSAVTPTVTGTATPAGTSAVTPTVTGTATPAGTSAVTPTVTGTAGTTGQLQQGGAIVNERDMSVLPTLPLTQEQISSKQVNIPNLATFKLVPCQKNLC